MCLMSHVANLSAQESFVKVGQWNDIRFIPACWTNGEAVYMLSESVDGDKVTSYKIYDKDFKLVKSFTHDPYYVKKRIEKREIGFALNQYFRWVDSFNISYLYERIKGDIFDDSSYFTKEEIMEMWKTVFESGQISLNPDEYTFYNDSTLYPKSDLMYYDLDLLGYQAPHSIIKFSGVVFIDSIGEYRYRGNLLYNVNDYGGVKEVFNGDWTVKEDYDTISFGSYSFKELFSYDVDNSCEFNRCSSLSQTFFNDDECFEYICPKYDVSDLNLSYEMDRDYDGEIDYKEYRSDLFETGFNLYSDGKIINSLDVEFRDYWGLTMFKFGGKNYFAFEGDHYIVYSVDKSTNSIESVEEFTSAKMSVNNDVVEIDLKNVVKEKCELVITNVAGQYCGKIDIENGSESVRYDTRALEKGVYNFIVLQKGKIIENGKILIR